MSLFGLLALAAAVIWLVRRVRPRGVSVADGPSDGGFRVVFTAGRVTRVDGRVPRTIYNAFEDVAVRTGADGEVRLTDDDELRFSGSITEPVRQQLRNVYFAGRTR